eukprot:1141629-Pelagomonas_calceolata.AAC.4
MFTWFWTEIGDLSEHVSGGLRRIMPASAGSSNTDATAPVHDTLQSLYTIKPHVSRLSWMPAALTTLPSLDVLMQKHA